jgi:hypothetical protein
MLKRVWLLCCLLYEERVFILNGTTKVNGIGEGDMWLAVAPFAIWRLLAIAARFVVTGSTAAPPRADARVP